MIIKKCLALIVRMVQIIAFGIWVFLMVLALDEGSTGQPLWILFGVGFVVLNLLQWVHMRLTRPPTPRDITLDDLDEPENWR